MVDIVCGFCSKHFAGKKSQRKNRFCSMNCRNKWLRTPANKSSKNWFRKGHTINNGRVLSEQTKKLLSINHNPLSNLTGEKAANWNGGRQMSLGYVLVYSPEHPNNSKGYVREHRLVMEKHLGRYLDRSEQVHHINGIKTDNRLNNLMLFSNAAEHSKHHHEDGTGGLHKRKSNNILSLLR